MAAVAPILFLPEMQRRASHPGELSSLLATSSAMSETIPPSLGADHDRLGDARPVDRRPVHRRVDAGFRGRAGAGHRRVVALAP